MDEAMHLFRKVVCRGLKPNIVTYSTLLQGLFHLGKCSTAQNLLAEMQADGITPDLQIYAIVLDGFCKNNHIEALSLFRSMETCGSNSDVVFYNILVKRIKFFVSWCIGGRGTLPDIFSYNTLMNGFFKNAMMDEAMHMFREVFRKGLKPNIATYNTMLQGLFHLGKCSTARDLVAKMQADGIVAPALQTYAIVLDGLCKHNQIAKALSLFRSMGTHRSNSDVVLYNILIQATSKSGKFDTASDLFEKLCSKGLQPNVRTYSDGLIKGHVPH